MVNDNQTALMMSIQRKKDRIRELKDEIERICKRRFGSESPEYSSNSNLISFLEDEITEDEKLLAVEPAWKTFAEKPENTKVMVIVQSSDESMGIWRYSVAEKFPDVHKLMWQELPKPYKHPRMVLTPKYGTDGK